MDGYDFVWIVGVCMDCYALVWIFGLLYGY